MSLHTSVFYITTCPKNQHKLMLMRTALLQQLKARSEVYSVFGGAPRQDGYTLVLDCEENYVQLPLKTFRILQHFYNKTTFERLFKIDDDTFIAPDRIPQNIFDCDYGGYVNQVAKRAQARFWNNYKIAQYGASDSTTYLNRQNVCDHDYVTGGFYVLSRKAVKYILENFDEAYFHNTPETYKGEDIKIGYCVSTNPDLIVLDNALANNLDLELCENFSAIHPVHPIIHNKLVDKTNAETLAILTQYNFLNEHSAINNYLNTNKQ